NIGDLAEGQTITNALVATFTDPGNPTGDLSAEPSGRDYRADIDWGDGTGVQPNSGTVAWDSSSHVFKVLGTHTYAEESSDDHTPTGGPSYTIGVQLHHEDTPPPAPLSLTATVADPALTHVAPAANVTYAAENHALTDVV